MGWIPHHYRTTVVSVPFASYEYTTVRGKMKTTIANSVDITYKFTGILPIYPAPEKSGGPHDYNPDQMKKYLTAYGGFNEFRDGTYWGGKDVLQTAWAMTAAKLLNDPSYAADKEHLKAASPTGLPTIPRGTTRSSSTTIRTSRGWSAGTRSSGATSSPTITSITATSQWPPRCSVSRTRNG